MKKPRFSVAVIAKNEALTLPKLVGSLQEFQERGGEICVLDTGSTDDTVAVAESLGCKVVAVGDKFKINIDADLANKINNKFIIEGEEPVVKAGDSLFDFGPARNYAASIASNDMVAMPDCDEIYTKIDIDKLDQAVEDGFEQFEYNFVFSHDYLGNAVIKFRHSKFYDRRKMTWTGIIHEILGGPANRIFFEEDVVKLEHYQNVATNRSGYIKGLALDCFNHPEKDRNSHYFAREMYYLDRTKSAIKEFKNHISMGGWGTEAAQSMLYIGDCYKRLGDIGEMLKWYGLSVDKEARREPLMRVAEFYSAKNMHKQAVVYGEAALTITQLPFYSNHQPYYEHAPHELLYLSYWQLDDKVKSKEHWEKAIAFVPNSPKYLSDAQFYKDEKNKTLGKSLLDTYIEKLDNNINFVFVKRGDGEIACMSGTKGANCDGHNYSPELGARLAESFEFLKDKADIIEWNDQANYNTFLHRTDSDLKKVRTFWTKIKESNRRKIFVGPTKLKDVNAFLGGSLFVPVPEINAFDHLEDIKLPQPQDGDLWIFCAGMPAKLLIAEQIKRNQNITCIDAGSAFDPIFAAQSRTHQADKDTLRRLYLPVPSQDEFNRMFSIPQDVHPERFFKLARISDSDKVIYDLGCSTFKTIDRAIGVDIENKEGVDLVSSIDDLPTVANDSVDVILASHIIEHLADTGKLLKEWHRILKPGGRIVFILPDDEVVDTLSPPLSNGLHLQAFTRQQWADTVKKFDGLEMTELVTSMEGWSFGGVIIKRLSILPKITFVLPTLGREEGLIRCLKSIENLNYPEDKIEVIVKPDSYENRIGVPKLVKQGVEEATGEWIVFASNDTEFAPDSINEALAVGELGYVAFNTGIVSSDEGNINEHFMIRKDIIEKIGEVFDTDFWHTGCDNLLYAKIKKLGIFVKADKAIVKHYHFTRGAGMDETYKLGWRADKRTEDAALLAKKLLELKQS